MKTPATWGAQPLAIVLFAGLLIRSPAAHAAPRILIERESQIGFVVKELGVPIDGRFRRFEAVMVFEPATPELSSVNLRIDIGSLTTGNEEADAIATGPDWLDKEHAPYAEFSSRSVRALGPDRYEAQGQLKIRNKTRDIAVRFDKLERPDGRTVVGGEFNVQRSEFGVGGGTWNQVGVVSETIAVKVRLVLEAVDARIGS